MTARVDARATLRRVISPHQALALRRLLLWAGALAATIGADALATHGLTLTPAAPVIWFALASLTVRGIGSKNDDGVWEERSAASVLVRVTALQVLLHCVMSVAPWSLGLAGHHPPALVTPGALVAHGVATVILVAILTGAERLLSIALCLVRAIRAVLREASARGRHRPSVAPSADQAPREPRRRPHRARGPPAVALGPIPRVRRTASARPRPTLEVYMRASRAVLTLLIGGLTAAIAAPALAHTEVVSAGPKEGAVVAHLPRTIIVNLSEVPQKVVKGAVLFGGTDDVATRTRLSAKNARQVRIATRSDRRGSYTVKVTILLPDGHTQLITHRFRVAR